MEQQRGHAASPGSRRHLAARWLQICSFFSLVFHAASLAQAQVSVEALPQEAHPLTPLEITATVAEGVNPDRVELYYRSAATVEFRAVPMSAEAQGRYRATIPAADVVPPGVELYIRLTDRNEKTYSDPPEGPTVRLHSVTVSHVIQPGRPLPIASFDPAPGGVVVGRRPLLKVTLAPEAPPLSPGRVVVMIDGTDVTAQLEITEREVRLRPASALNPGAHVATLTFLDPADQFLEPISWPFTVRDYGVLREGSFVTDLTWNSEYATDKLRRSDPDWKASTNLKVTGKAAEEAFEAAVDGNLRWFDQEKGIIPGIPRGEMTLVNGLMSFAYEKTRFEIGDLSLSESFLTTGPSFPRRGLKLSGEGFGTGFTLFGVRPEPVTGFTHLTGVNHPDNRVTGASLSRPLIGEQALALKGVVVDGRSESPTSFNIGSAGGGTEGTTYGLQLISQLFNNRLRSQAEWALSNADLALRDDIGRKKDQAWRFRIEGSPPGFTLGSEYQRLGRDFTSLANPTLLRDRQNVTSDATTILGPTNWRLAYSWGHDNVRDDRDVPRVIQHGPTASLGLTIPDYPAFNLSYTKSDQDSRHVPAGLTPTEIVTDTISSSLSYFRPTWNALLGTGFTAQQFKKGSGDSENLNLTLGLGFTPLPSINLSPGYTLSRQKNRDTDVITFTHVPTFTGRVAIIPQVLIFDMQSFYTQTKDTKGLTDNRAFSSTVRLSWLLKDLLKGYAEPALSLRLNYNRTKDDVTATNNRKEFGLFLVFDLYARLPLLPPTWLEARQPNGKVPGAGIMP